MTDSAHSVAACNVNRTAEEANMETMTPEREFVAWPKIPRFNRETIITEKIDGTNACVVITPDDIYAQSRKQIITPERDNHGFAKWVAENADTLRDELGEGRHFGEWWGSGIGKRYGAHLPQGEKRFSLFNVRRFPAMGDDFRAAGTTICHVVPVLGNPDRLCTKSVDLAVEYLRHHGSRACPGAKAEGVIVFHHQGYLSFKVTLEKDAEWKGADRVA